MCPIVPVCIRVYSNGLMVAWLVYEWLLSLFHCLMDCGGDILFIIFLEFNVLLLIQFFEFSYRYNCFSDYC